MLAFNVDDLRDPKYLNVFTNEHIFENMFIELTNQEIIQNSDIFHLDNTYIARPDKIAFELYGDDLFYPWILQANSISSIFNFIPSDMDFQCYVPKLEYIQNYLN